MKKKKNPKGKMWGKEHVNRGGFAFVQAVNCRSADRYRNDPSNAFDALGLRLVFKEKDEKEKES